MADGVRHRRLTVVDDSPDVLDVLGEALRFDGAEVALFDGSVTLQDIEESVPELLVIDLRLSGHGLTGLELIRRLRSHRELRRVPVIVCSAAHDVISELDDELSRIPHLSVLPKPFSLDDLESCVQEALGQRPEAKTGT
jgi:CheY-like chemotaxis protein